VWNRQRTTPPHEEGSVLPPDVIGNGSNRRTRGATCGRYAWQFNHKASMPAVLERTAVAPIQYSEMANEARGGRKRSRRQRTQ